MAQQTHLNKAPITEALLDIRTRFPEDFKAENLESLFPIISDEYPEKRTRRQVTSSFSMREGQPLPTISKEVIDGFLFHSSDKKQIFQARIDGFTFNRLSPYENWEKFRDEAKRLWDFYKKVSTIEIQRIGLRYINKINIPTPDIDFSDYLTTAPRIPDELPQGVSSFLTRVVFVEPTYNYNAIITQAIEQIVDPKFLPLILDIDVFEQCESLNEEEVWDSFENLRELKNKFFFSFITEKTKELFI